jgi:hypothetical protein
MKTFSIMVVGKVYGGAHLEVEAANEEEALKIASETPISELQELCFDLENELIIEDDWFDGACISEE